MTLSKEARILLAIFAVLGLGFAWLHFSTRFGESAPAAVNTPVPNRERASSTPVPQQLEEQTAGLEAQIAEQDEPRVARDLQVAQLPFLVTAPPAAPEALADAETEFGAEESQIQEAQASGSQRASVNPFSPLVVAEANPEPDTSPNPNADQRITDVPVPPPPQTAAAPTPRRAPIPAARAPGAAGTLGATRLPRSLPSGTLASTPDVLRNTLSTPVNAQRSQNPLASGEADDAAPLAAGSSSLSLYLRDQEVTFTGAVLGPVSVGIFRSANAAAPFLVPLGQSIPDTDIVLTDLTGQQAELSQGDTSQLLILNRR